MPFFEKLIFSIQENHPTQQDSAYGKRSLNCCNDPQGSHETLLDSRWQLKWNQNIGVLSCWRQDSAFHQISIAWPSPQHGNGAQPNANRRYGVDPRYTQRILRTFFPMQVGAKNDSSTYGQQASGFSNSTTSFPMLSFKLLPLLWSQWHSPGGWNAGNVLFSDAAVPCIFGAKDEVKAGSRWSLRIPGTQTCWIAIGSWQAFNSAECRAMYSMVCMGPLRFFTISQGTELAMKSFICLDQSSRVFIRVYPFES